MGLREAQELLARPYRDLSDDERLCWEEAAKTADYVFVMDGLRYVLGNLVFPFVAGPRPGKTDKDGGGFWWIGEKEGWPHPLLIEAYCRVLVPKVEGKYSGSYRSHSYQSRLLTAVLEIPNLDPDRVRAVVCMGTLR